MSFSDSVIESVADVQASGSRLVVGRWSSQDPAHRFYVENPATGEAIAEVQGGGAAEVDAAIVAAEAAFPSWAARPASERSEILHAISRHLRQHADEIAALESLEMGKPLSQARIMDVEACINTFAFFADVLADHTPPSHQLGAIQSDEYIEPFGVVAGIIPFNWPPIHFGGKVAPALAVGNAIVLKPGEQAPLTIMRLVELVQEILPDDVIHVVPGGREAGAALASHPGVKKISFTGAPATGAEVLRTAAQNLTPALMELGGKNALIVFADADLDAALGGALEGAFINQGEACTAASRILVERSIYPEFARRMAAAVRRLKVGDGAEPTTHIGPMVDRRQMTRVEEYIEIGIGEGAKVLAQAELPTDPRLASGYFVKPTLFGDVTSDMRIAREEIFGPVTALMAFDNDDEAVRIANATEFGLVAAIYTSDAERMRTLPRRIRSGMVFVNNYNRVFLGSPFGGVGASGFGREHCKETLAEFGFMKAVRTPNGSSEVKSWGALPALLGTDDVG